MNSKTIVLLATMLLSFVLQNEAFTAGAPNKVGKREIMSDLSNYKKVIRLKHIFSLRSSTHNYTRTLISIANM